MGDGAQPQLIPIRDVIHILGVSRATVYRAVAAGQIPVTRVGHRIFVLRQPFERWLQGEPPQNTG